MFHAMASCLALGHDKVRRRGSVSALSRQLEQVISVCVVAWCLRPQQVATPFTWLAQVVIIGTDVPDLHQGILAQALAALDDHQVTLRNRMASVDSLFESLLCCTSSEVL